MARARSTTASCAYLLTFSATEHILASDRVSYLFFQLLWNPPNRLTQTARIYKECEMKSSKIVVAIVFVIVFAVSAAMAQYSSRDNPSSLNSGEFTGNMNDLNKETFYSFTAGPGQVTITVDVNAKYDSQGLLTFEVLARNGATNLACCYGAQGNGGGTGREAATFNVPKRQTVILHTTNGPIGGGTFRIRITGAASFGGGPSVGDNNGDNRNDGGNRNDSNYPRGNRGGGDPVDVPSSGILRIRMKDGSVKDIDLSRVRNISIH